MNSWHNAIQVAAERDHSESCTPNWPRDLARQKVAEKGFSDNECALIEKLLCAFMEFGEAADAFRKGED